MNLCTKKPAYVEYERPHLFSESFRIPSGFNMSLDGLEEENDELDPKED